MADPSFSGLYSPTAGPPPSPLPEPSPAGSLRRRTSSRSSSALRHHPCRSPPLAVDALHASTNAGETLVVGGGGDDDPVLDLREAEVLSSAEPVSSFPAAIRQAISWLHPSVLAVVAAERSAAAPAPAFENISHRQLQVLSAMLPDHPSLSNNLTSHPHMSAPRLHSWRAEAFPSSSVEKLLVVPRAQIINCAE